MYIKIKAMPTELDALIEKLLAVKTFGVFCAPDTGEESHLSAGALILGLAQSGKSVACDPPPKDFHARWSALLPEEKIAPPAQPLTIAIPKKNSGAEIACDEKNGELILTITSEAQIALAEIRITKSPSRLETVFCFAENEELLAPLAARFTLPPKNRIALIAANGRRPAEKAADLLRALGGDAWSDPVIATLLFAALIAGTENFQKNLSSSVLTLAAELLKNGANKEKIRAVQRPAEIPPDMKTRPLNAKSSRTAENKILGRALARTYRDEAACATWTFLLPQDLEKTGAAPETAFFAELRETMRRVLPATGLHLFVWKEAGGLVHSLAFADRNETLKTLAAKFDACSENGANFIKLPSFPNFSAAEKNLRELLRDFEF